MLRSVWSIKAFLSCVGWRPPLNGFWSRYCLFALLLSALWLYNGKTLNRDFPINVFLFINYQSVVFCYNTTTHADTAIKVTISVIK